jgi:hypothetical protein
VQVLSPQRPAQQAFAADGASEVFIEVGLATMGKSLGEVCVAAAEMRRWAVSSGNLSLIILDESFPPEFGGFSISWIRILQKLVQAVELVLRLVGLNGSSKHVDCPETTGAG